MLFGIKPKDRKLLSWENVKPDLLQTRESSHPLIRMISGGVKDARLQAAEPVIAFLEGIYDVFQLIVGGSIRFSLEVNETLEVHPIPVLVTGRDAREDSSISREQLVA